MRRPRLSTGAWIFASVVAAAIVTPTAVYAAATSTVAIGNTSDNRTATVTDGHQLLTATAPSKNLISAFAHLPSNGACTAVYTPPAGKAIVVTSVTYDVGSNSAGTDSRIALTQGGCFDTYDIIETTQKVDTEQRTFPTGLPLPSVGAVGAGGFLYEVYITGYLIQTSQLPAAVLTPRPTATASHP